MQKVLKKLRLPSQTSFIHAIDMLTFLPGPIKGIIAAIYAFLNTLLWCILLYFFTFLKILSPQSRFGLWSSRMAVRMAENWAAGSMLGLSIIHNIKWEVDLQCELDYNKSYLVCANHIAWVDILTLLQFLNRRVPFLRFFIKQELMYVPLLGAAWWSLDYPFMKRHSKEYLEKHPEKRNEDLESTRRSCARFKGKNIAVINFLEGTRFTKKKHLQQNSPYKHLLRPKSGGIAFVLEAMGEQFHSLLDVTICYPQGDVTMWGLLCGKMNHAILRVEERPIPKEFLGRTYFEDAAFREELQKWTHEIWQRKDAYLEKCLLKSCQHK